MNKNKLFNALQNKKELKFTFENQELEKLEQAIFTKENLEKVKTKVASNSLYEGTDLYNFINKNTNISNNNQPLNIIINNKHQLRHDMLLGLINNENNFTIQLVNNNHFITVNKNRNKIFDSDEKEDKRQVKQCCGIHALEGVFIAEELAQNGIEEKDFDKYKKYFEKTSEKELLEQRKILFKMEILNAMENCINNIKLNPDVPVVLECGQYKTEEEEEKEDKKQVINKLYNIYLEEFTKICAALTRVNTALEYKKAYNKLPSKEELDTYIQQKQEEEKKQRQTEEAEKRKRKEEEEKQRQAEEANKKEAAKKLTEKEKTPLNEQELKNLFTNILNNKIDKVNSSMQISDIEKKQLEAIEDESIISKALEEKSFEDTICILNILTRYNINRSKNIFTTVSNIIQQKRKKQEEEEQIKRQKEGLNIEKYNKATDEEEKQKQEEEEKQKQEEKEKEEKQAEKKEEKNNKSQEQKSQPKQPEKKEERKITIQFDGNKTQEVSFEHDKRNTLINRDDTNKTNTEIKTYKYDEKAKKLVEIDDIEAVAVKLYLSLLQQIIAEGKISTIDGIQEEIKKRLCNCITIKDNQNNNVEEDKLTPEEKKNLEIARKDYEQTALNNGAIKAIFNHLETVKPGKKNLNCLYKSLDGAIKEIDEKILKKQETQQVS